MKLMSLVFALALAAVLGGLSSAHAACTLDYAPVCAVGKDGVRSNYSNACRAKEAKATILHTGNCIGPICLPWVNTVCAIDPKTKKKTEYNSLCYAENANAVLVNYGPCK